MEGPDAPGASQSTAPPLNRPIESIEQSGRTSINYVEIRTELGLIEHTLNVMTANINRVFGEGNLSDRSLRQRWMWRDFRGGLLKAVRLNASGALYLASQFSTLAEWRFVHINTLLTSVLEEELELLPQEHWDLADQALDLQTRIEKLDEETYIHYRVLNDFARINLPE